MARSKEIKRVIYVDNIEDVDYENFGVHFTADMNYRHKGGGSNGGTPKARYQVTVFVKRKYEINEDATKMSNEEYPREKEVVLEFNQDLDCEISIMDNGKFLSLEKGKINTGNRCDLWVTNPI